MELLWYSICSAIARIVGLLFLSLLIGTEYTAAKYRDVKLVGDESLRKGILNVLNDINWGSVCGNTWSKTNSDVACRHLGFPNASSVTIDGGRFRTLEGDTWLGDVQCNGDEEYIWGCSHTERPICDHTQDVRLVCNVPGYVGCYGNDKTDWVLNARHYRSTALTIQACLEFCWREQFEIAGLENGDCYCGHDYDDYARLGQFDDEECNIVCAGNRDDACGGINKLSVYNVSLSFCSDLDAPVGGWHLGDSMFFGESLTFGCNNGVQLIGNDVIQCINCDDGVKWSTRAPYCFGVTAKPTPGMVNSNAEESEGRSDSTLQENGVIIWTVAGVAGVFLIATLLLVTLAVRSKKNKNSGNVNIEDNSIDFDLEPAGPTGTYRHSMHSLHLLDSVQENQDNATTQEKTRKEKKDVQSSMYLREEMKEGVGMQANALAVFSVQDEDDLEWDENIELESEFNIDPRTSAIVQIGRTTL